MPQAIREQMRKTTWQTATTDEPKISTLGVDEIPVAVCDTGTIKNLGAYFLICSSGFLAAVLLGSVFDGSVCSLCTDLLGHFAC